MDEQIAAEKKHPKVWIIAAVSLLLTVIILLGIVTALACGSRVYPNTFFLGQKLSGMDVEQARNYISNILARQSENGGIALQLSDGTEAAAISFRALDVELKPADSEEPIWCRGEQGAVKNAVNFIGALFGRRTELAARCTVGQGRIDEAVKAVSQKLDCEPVDFACVERDVGGIYLTKSRDGLCVDAEKLSDIISESLATWPIPETAQLPCRVLPAKQGDLSVVLESMLGEMTNASYDKEKQCIIPSSVGYSYSFDALQKTYQTMQAGETRRLSVEVTLPKVTTEQLEKCLFRDKLSSYTTKVGGAEGRHENVRVTADRVNGIVLNAGESIKYGELVMPFTAENGYFPAPGYVQGKTVDLIGGGVCQTSSTLYAAALYANLEIVQRRNHGFASDYIDLGLDATVAEGGPEFEVRNNTDYPIRIEAEFKKQSGKDTITVSLYGTKTDDSYVKVTSEILSTTPFDEEIVETDELKPGERVVEQTAYTGYVVKTYRNVYAGDGTLLSKTTEATSRYNARNRIVKVGKSIEVPASPAEEQPAAASADSSVTEQPGAPEQTTEQTTVSEPVPGTAAEAAAAEPTPQEGNNAQTAAPEQSAVIKTE